MADLFQHYGLKRFVGVSGTETVRGASPVAPEVLEAVGALIPHMVEMAALQSVASSVIARAYGTEAGCVTGCSAAGIAVAVAAAMTGRDLAKVEQLPDTTGMKDEVILQRGHDVTWGGHIRQTVRLTGARLVEIGAATECGVYQLRHALSERTAAAVYVVRTRPADRVDQLQDVLLGRPRGGRAGHRGCGCRASLPRLGRGRRRFGHHQRAQAVRGPDRRCHCRPSRAGAGLHLAGKGHR